ncbi:MAG TPA: mechanosensitive ion channel domain-containing protein [Planctomycetota bacterium]
MIPFLALLQDPPDPAAAISAGDVAGAGTVFDPVAAMKDPAALVQTFVDFGIEYAPKLLGALVTLVVGIWLARLGRKLIRRGLEKARLEVTLSAFLANFAYLGMLALIAVAVIGKLGVETASFVAAVGAAGLAVGFALQGSLSNFAAGVMIMLFRPFKAGDWVDVAGQSGTIEEIQTFFTLLKTADNKRVIIPNSKITDASIVNYSAKPQRRIDLVFGIGYGDDMGQAKRILQQVLADEARVLADPKPVIAVSELGDSSVNLVLRPWVKTADYWPTRFDLIEKVKNEFDAQGIQIPFPQRDVHLHQAPAQV